jgi:hypothetical protein
MYKMLFVVMLSAVATSVVAPRQLTDCVGEADDGDEEVGVVDGDAPTHRQSSMS